MASRDVERKKDQDAVTEDVDVPSEEGATVPAEPGESRARPSKGDTAPRAEPPSPAITRRPDRDRPTP